MKTLLLALSLPAAAFAQEYLGAAKALERLAAETAPEKAAAKKPNPAEQWAARATSGWVCGLHGESEMPLHISSP